MLSKLSFVLNQLFLLLRIERRHLPVFAFLLTLSTLFWILTVLSKDYTTTVHYKADFIDLPVDKLLIDEEEVDLHLQVIAPGFTILAHRLSFRNELPLSVSSFIPKKKGNYWNYFLLGEQSISQIQEVIPTSMQLLHIQPNRIDLLLDEKAERVVPVKLKSSISFKDLFRQKEAVKLEPSTIVISGPKAVVEVFDEINTELLSLEDVDNNKNGEIEIQSLNHSEINYSAKNIKWELKVEQFTEGEIKLPIEMKNVPKGYEIKLFPDEVTVSYLISLDKFDLVKPDMFAAQILFDSDFKRQSVNLSRQADFVENVRVFPSKVEYFLIKK
ncbi:hypothetical protein N9358_01030 [Flavobacteriales bacterium]|jgi:hypothetical protein|nr:hypothetical protein [Flavobacteriales bacterium]